MKTLNILIALGLLVAAGFVWFALGTDYSAGAPGSGTKLLIQDITAVAAGLLLAAILLGTVRRVGRSSDTTTPYQMALLNPVSSLLAIWCCWGCLSVVDWATEKKRTPLPTDTTRFDTVPKGDWRGSNVAIALSGGGYRAALLHAGILYELEKRGVLVTHISSVSGGSIIAAFYALGGRPNEFKQAVIDGRLNLRRYLLRMDVLLAIACPDTLFRGLSPLARWCGKTRVDAQSELLDRVLLGNKDWNALAMSESPRLLINTTDLNNAVAVGLTADDVVFGNIVSGQSFSLTRRSDEWGISVPHEFTLSRAVAVSGAFPGPFPATKLRLEIKNPLLGKLREEHPLVRQWLDDNTVDGLTRTVSLALSDGGILDNTGLLQLQNARHLAYSPQQRPGLMEKWEFERGRRLSPVWRNYTAILGADGGKSIGNGDYRGTLEVVARAIDVATGPTQRAAITNISTVRKLPVAYFRLGPDALARFHLHDRGTVSRSFAIAADDGLPVDQPAGAYLLGPLAHASSRVLITPGPLRDGSLHFLEDILADSPEVSESLARFKQVASAPRVAIPRGKKSAFLTRPDFRQAVPWERNYATLLEWIKKGECIQQNKESPDAEYFCATLELLTRVAADIDRLVSHFHATDTLKTQFTEEQANAVFRLGRYLVHMSLPSSHADLIKLTPKPRP